jgi:tRNA nucleotidyltransferase (CCA-adding enzyme)
MKELRKMTHTQITLREQERRILELLQNVVKDKTPDTTIRVAGGWVRDRLLGLESHDIDIAVDNMSGTQFANFVLEWMQENGIKTHRKVATVEANTEANKNLESAILPIFGVEIDFAQLRRETYDFDSRNPVVEVGVTPEEDARRRDLTINALFYNIATGEVEDYVNGFEDLKDGWARTPIEPIQTFLEDPLRILRIIRFAARLNLTVCHDIVEAAKNSAVQEALQRKISRERIWTEFSKFMTDPNFHRAVRLMHQMGLRDLLLSPTEQQMGCMVARQEKYNKKKWVEGFGNWDADQKNPYHNLTIWNHTLAAMKYLSNIEGEHDVMLTSIAMLFHDIGKCDACSTQVHPDGKHSYKEHELSSAVMTHKILTDMKAPNDIRDRVVKLVKNHMRLHQLPMNSKSGLRRIIRDIGAEDWTNFVAMSKSDSMGKKEHLLDPKYDHFDEYAKEYLESLDGRSEVKPPINGHEVMSLLGLKPGKAIGIIMTSLKEQLLIDPDMTKEEATKFVKSCKC